MTGNSEGSVVEIKPEVVFLYEILQELTRGLIKIPRFQRAFVWRPDQMTELLDSINKQYPIGSLLVWETGIEIATLDRLGPFVPSNSAKPSVGYLLDGHQRLMTLAGALLPGSESLSRESRNSDSKWEMFWNVRSRRFQHRTASDSDEVLFPMTSLLDTIRFFESVERLRSDLGGEAMQYVNEVSELARTFQSYRIPVIRIRQTGLSEAVEIFARLNSRGQSMTPDQMVSALSFRQEGGVTFDLADEIDGMLEALGERNFAEIDRGTVLRAILAGLDEDIYRTDWTKLASDRRDELQVRLQDGVDRAQKSLTLAIDFLDSVGVTTGRLLPYGLQLVLLSAFFDKQPYPSDAQLSILRRWFWVSSFSAWFGGANPSRITAVIKEFRDQLAVNTQAQDLKTFDLRAEALPFPTNFDMRSARTRALLLVMLDAPPLDSGRDYREQAGRDLSRKGPAAVGHIYWSPPKEFTGNPANRLFRPPSAPRGGLVGWLEQQIAAGDELTLAHAGVDRAAAVALRAGNPAEFIRRRQAVLTEWETAFQTARGVTPSLVEAAEAPVDTE